MGRMFNDLMRGLDEIDAYMSGKTEGFKSHVPPSVDVKRIRSGLRMTQARFSEVFGFSLDAVKNWEIGRRTPESSARVLLTVIERDPVAVLRALETEEKSKKKKAAAVTATRPGRLSNHA